jgi:hypothetical protein
MAPVSFSLRSQGLKRLGQDGCVFSVKSGIEPKNVGRSRTVIANATPFRLFFFFRTGIRYYTAPVPGATLASAVSVVVVASP